MFDKPGIVTWDKMLRVLLPYISTYPWALDTIGDLWRMGAPTPDSVIGTPNERRILLPSQVIKWWGDVQQRMGIDPSVNPFKEFQ